MTTHRNLCRLCVSQCEDHKSLFDQNGQCTGVYQLMDKYFNSKLLNSGEGSCLSVLCMLCWRQIFDFHNFQQFVFESQEKLNFKSPHKPETKYVDNAIDVKEFLQLESTVPNTVQQQPSGCSFIQSDVSSLSLSQQENIDVFSIADSSPDYEFTLPDECVNPEKIGLEEYISYNDINEITEILSSDEEELQADHNMNESEFEIPGSCNAAVAVEIPPQTLNSSQVTKELTAVPNPNDKTPNNSLMDVDDDAVIAQWKPHLECRLCSQNYPSFKLLRQHFRQKHPLSNFYVVCCRRKFIYRCKFGEHIRRHMNPYPYKCTLCVKSYTHKSNLISHMHTHQKYKVNKKLNVGQTEIVSVKELNGAKNSLETVTNIEELLRSGKGCLPVQCDVKESDHTSLGKYTKKKKSKRFSVTTLPSGGPNSSIVLNDNSSKVIHEDDAVIAQWKPSLNCEVCGQTYLTFTSLRKHFREKHSRDTFYIECCLRKFKYRCKLVDHIRRHINPYPFKCNFCAKSYSQRAKLITHMQDTHDHRPKMTDKQLDSLIEQWKQDLECSHCNRTYTSLTLLRHHFRYKHPKKIFHVLCCGRKLMRRWEIEGHIRSHLKIFVSIFRCEQCDICFTSRRTLDRHKFICHKDNINREQFDNVASDQDKKDNIEQLDSAITQWKSNLNCMACNKTLSTYSLLQEHYLKEHPNDKCYIVCCRQTLKKHSQIEEHMRLHCNPETYACTLCDECFISSEDLNNHKQRTHPETSTNGRRVSSRQKTHQSS